MQNAKQNHCPMQANWTDSQILGFVLACEGDNQQSPQGAADIAYLILNRMQSGAFVASSAANVVKTKDQFDCYSVGATPSNPAYNYSTTPAQLQPIVNALVNGNRSQIPIPASNPDINHIGLYYYGTGSYSQGQDVKLLNDLYSHGCNMITYIGHSAFPAPTGNLVNTFFSDQHTCP